MLQVTSNKNEWNIESRNLGSINNSVNVLYLLCLISYEHLQIKIQNFIKKSMENYIMVSASLRISF